MGASNVTAVITYWSHLPGDAFKVLTYMAVITIDRDDPPTYWGGSDALIAAIGRGGHEPVEADYRALRRAIKPLVDNSVVSVEKGSGPGRSPVYALHLTPVTF